MRVLCLGASYTGLYLARCFRDRCSVSFASRRPDFVIAEGFHPLPLVRVLPDDGFKVLRPETNTRNLEFELILDTVPAVEGASGEVKEPPYAGVIERVLDSSPKPKASFVHLSSTSVYPGGRTAPEYSDVPTLDETSIAGPTQKRGRNRLEVEAKILENFPSAMIVT